ncbi:unnamed protein product [Allacma fusca]|uniref:Ionotropic glutamate receptor C-terminal domain-containing protein n=1 Tax=Allacma fusca TaxID=39272 RepID=A0A8J2NLM0_9HEXA|nr:unnamed protein product [Allacma fusca]
MEWLYSIWITVIILIYLSSISAWDPKLSQLLKLMNTNEEILVISGPTSSALKTEMNSAEEILNSRLVSLSRGIPFFEGNNSRISFSPTGSDSLKTRIIAIMETAEESTDFIIKMAGLRGQDKTYQDYWTLVLWPNSSVPGQNDSKISDLSNILKSTPFMTSYLVSSSIYLGYSKENVSENVTFIEQLFDFYEIYAIGEEIITREVTTVGSVFSNNVTVGECETQTCRRLDLNGIKLRAQGVEDPEFQNDTDYKMNEETKTVELTDGFSVQIFLITQTIMNFSYTASIMTPTMARSIGEISAWDGVIQQAEKGEVDIGFSLTVHLPNRQSRVHFISSTDDYIISAFFRPSSLNAIRDIFMQPFKADLWAAVVSSWLVLAFAMVLFTVIRKRIGAMGSDEPDLAESSFIWALATACQQGWDEHPVAGSLRAIFISGSLTGVVAYAGYSAAIVSTLSLRSDPIKTPADLIGSNMILGIRFGFLDNVLSNLETDDVITRIYHRLSKHPHEGRVNVSTGFDIMERKEYAFVCIRDTFYDTISQIRDDKEICNLRDLQILKHGFPAGPLLPKSSPYKELFRLVITRVRERGVLWRLKVYYAYSRRCLASSDNTGLALGLNDVFTAFMILLGGYALSLTFLFVEKLLYVNKLKYIQ